MAKHSALALGFFVSLLSACTADSFTGSDAASNDAGSEVAPLLQPVVVASGLQGPYGVAIAGNHLYVTEYVDHGRVLDIVKNGLDGQVPVIVADEPTLAALVSYPAYVTKPFSITATATDIFWTDVGGLASSGFTKLFHRNTQQVVSPFYEICAQGQVIADDLKVYWANQVTKQCQQVGQNGLFRADIVGGHDGSVYYPMTGPFASAVALYGNRVFAGAGNQLLIYDADLINDPSGVTNAQLGGSSMLSAPPYAIASDVDNVVWTDNASPGNVYSLKKTATANTTPTIVASKLDTPLGIVIEDPGNFIYFTTFADGKLLRVRKDGSASPEVLLEGLNHPAFIAADATSLYITIAGTPGASDGSVIRLSKPN